MLGMRCGTLNIGLLLSAVIGLLTIWNFDILPVEFCSKHLFNCDKANDIFNKDIQDNTSEIWLRDWHDVAAMEIELNRTGLGENGDLTSLQDYQKKLYMDYGFDALLSDYISVNRSVPDLRDPGCRNITYLSQLPKTAVIITCYNERLSVLLRTVHSILNRTPAELLEEIIIVDDFSTRSELREPLDNYMALHLPTKVRLIRLEKRSGLMVARMAGARAASLTSKVYVFFDSHIETMHNWLPPLLEPIVFNRRTVTCVCIDTITYDTIQYRKNGPFRGYFTWGFWYRLMPLREEELANPTKPYYNNVAMGMGLTLSADFFWEIGGFDEGMEIWGAEQYEISFKIWMCGGELIDVPCSRVGHLYRDADTKGNVDLHGNDQLANKNFRRLVDVWMDEEYREYVLQARPGMRTTDPGDLTAQIELRDRLKCKSFSWLMDNTMKDQMKMFPPVEPAPYMKGIVQSVLAPNLCLDRLDGRNVAIHDCIHNQQWEYTWRLEFKSLGYCLEPNGTLTLMWSCHCTGGNQKWSYDRAQKWIRHYNSNYCLAAIPEEQSIKVLPCESESLAFKWDISYVNNTAMDILDKEVEMEDLLNKL